MHIDKEALYEMCTQIDLFEYAGRTFDFVKKGYDSYATHCPLHTDKTPSLFISPKKNVFCCQSCHVGGNILTWLMKIEGFSFQKAVQKICKITGNSLSDMQVCESLRYFKEVKKVMEAGKRKKQPPIREILPENEIEKFTDESPAEWIEEGIPSETMKEFQIRIDEKANRIIYPVRDKDFQLIGFKGRTRFSNYKALGIQKYMNYTKIGTTDFFIGMMESKEYILEKNEVIIVEGIKSVMKLHSWGWKNSIAAETSILNENQIQILLKMRVKNIVIAFDNDVGFNDIKRKMKMLSHLTNVWIVADKANILGGDKMAPVDAGKEKWELLYGGKVKI